ncbi:hypothetical protein N431DRAFT_459831 [Stipitochalara longipes BDJ]|nr:hypothetical protein N431DRAFT_459831 [Stipitochalara longipes BDJ]
MFKKFEGPLWSSYIQWPNVVEAINNCTVPADSASRWPGGLRDRTCWNQLDCALTGADASQQAQYSSTSTILGLMPTVLSMMATSTDDLLLIHYRYPLLAFSLALCNPSTVLAGLNLVPSGQSTHEQHKLHSQNSQKYLQNLKNKTKISEFIHDLVLHLIAASIASIMVWQAVLLGVRGVIVYACWTWHEPLTWVGVGGLIHLLSVISWRLCLGPDKPENSWSRWYWTLGRSDGNLTTVYPQVSRSLDLIFQILGLMNYGYGTVMLSSTALVSPPNGLMVFCLIGFASLCSRLLALWILQVEPETTEGS